MTNRHYHYFQVLWEQLCIGAKLWLGVSRDLQFVFVGV
jgi:hypothetical protein